MSKVILFQNIYYKKVIFDCVRNESEEEGLDVKE